jgi:predicted hydrocarbon binding protein
MNITTTTNILLILAGVLFALEAIVVLSLRKRLKVAILVWSWLAFSSMLAVLLIASGTVGIIYPAAGSESDMVWLILGIILCVVGLFSLGMMIVMKAFLQSGGAYGMLPLSLLPSTDRRITSMYGDAAAGHVLYAIGKEVGEREFALYVKMSILKRQKMGWVIALVLNLLGLCKARITDYKEREGFTAYAKNSPEAIGKREKGILSCHLLRGVLAGFASAVYDDMYAECTETACVSEGSEVCEFHVRWFEKLPPSSEGGKELKKETRQGKGVNHDTQ